MNYNKWLSGEDIPTIRRMDYIVKGTDNAESGYLYAALRKMMDLAEFNNLKLSEKIKNRCFEMGKEVTQKQVNWVNEWMKAHNKDEIFTDINDWRAIGADYDYFWELRTEKQFVQEEKDARAGKSGRKPLDNVDLREFGEDTDGSYLE